TELDEWTDPAVPVVIDRLARARLLTADENDVQLAHEALLSCWPRLAGWLEEERDHLRRHRRLTEAAHAWEETDRDPGALYRGTRLDRAQELFTDDGALTTTERDFLAAALEARDAEHRTAARTARRTRILLTSLSAVLVVALVAGLTAWTQYRAGEQHRTDTAARRVAAIADSLRTTDPRTAMLLGTAAWQTSPLPETRQALFDAFTQPELDAFTAPVPGAGSNGFLADSGRTLLSVAGRTWRTWDVTTHSRTASGTLPPDAQVVTASPDGRVLAVTTGDGIRLWDRARNRWTAGTRPLPRAATGIAFGTSGHSYLVSDLDGDRVHLRSLPDDRPLFEIRASDASVVAPSPDDRQVAVCTAGQAPQVWDLRSRRTLPGAWRAARGLCDEDEVRVVFGHGTRTGDGKRMAGADRFAVISATGVRVWDIPTGHEVAALDAAAVTAADLSADGAFLATADDSEIKVWRLSSPDAPVFRQSLSADERQIDGALAWNPEHPVLRYLEGGTVHSYDTRTATTPKWRAHAPDTSLLAPDGRTLATAELIGARYQFVLRDNRDGHESRMSVPAPLPVLPDREGGPVRGRSARPLMAFSPDGTTFAYGVSVADGVATQRVTVRDVPHARVLTTVDLARGRPAEGVVTLALGPG
ncbi:WD40 repeat domain-containing protein, partial [Streptomyces sp. NPDC006356]